MLNNVADLREVGGVLVEEAAEDEVGLDGDAAARHAGLRGREAVGGVGRVARAHQEVVEVRVHVASRLVRPGQVQVGRVVLRGDGVRIFMVIRVTERLRHMYRDELKSGTQVV